MPAASETLTSFLYLVGSTKVYHVRGLPDPTCPEMRSSTPSALTSLIPHLGFDNAAYLLAHGDSQGRLGKRVACPDCMEYFVKMRIAVMLEQNAAILAHVVRV